MEANYFPAHQWLASAYIQKSMPEEAIQHARKVRFIKREHGCYDRTSPLLFRLPVTPKRHAGFCKGCRRLQNLAISPVMKSPRSSQASTNPTTPLSRCRRRMTIATTNFTD